jgi:hypothetical protein
MFQAPACPSSGVQIMTTAFGVQPWKEIRSSEVWCYGVVCCSVVVLQIESRELCSGVMTFGGLQMPQHHCTTLQTHKGNTSFLPFRQQWRLRDFMHNMWKSVCWPNQPEPQSTLQRTHMLHKTQQPTISIRPPYPPTPARIWHYW